MNSKIKTYKATFTEGVLGTNPNDADVHATYVAGKEREAAKEELDAEARALAELQDIEKGITIFLRDEENRPCVSSHVIKGFLKEAIKSLRRDPDTACAKLKNYKGVIDGSVFVEPRMIPLILPEGKELGMCSRPLRAETAQGPRVALAKSEEAPAGTTMTFSIKTLCPGLDKVLEECWEYAELRFMGAWRNSGKGTAKIEEIKEELKESK